MQRKDKWRLAASIGPPVILLSVAMIMACSDTVGTTNARRNASALSPVSATAAQRKSRDDIHSRNPMDWIGLAHNQALSSFRAELRKPGLLTQRFCSFLSTYAASSAHIPAERRRRMESDDDRRARAKHVESEVCGTKHLASLNEPRATPVSTSPPQEASPEAQALIFEIGSAVEQSSDPYDLSARLAPILNASFALDTSGQAAVATALGVAQNSFEYWQSELPVFQREMDDEYGACLQQSISSGYSGEDSRYICLNGGTLMTRGGVPSPRGLLRSTTVAAPFCASNAVAEGIRRVTRSDVDGAVAGFWGGLGATRTLIGAGLGALAVGVGKSGYEGSKVTWEILVCAYT